MPGELGPRLGPDAWHSPGLAWKGTWLWLHMKGPSKHCEVITGINLSGFLQGSEVAHQLTPCSEHL